MTRPPRPSTPDTPPPEESYPFWPTQVLSQGILLYLLFGLLLTLAIVWPFALHGQADPLRTPAAVKPEWYFLPVYQFLKYVPPQLGVVVVGCFLLAMLLWPFVDGALHRRLGHRRFVPWVGFGVLLLVVGLGLLGRVSGTTWRLGERVVVFTYHGVPQLSAAGEPQSR